MVTLNELLEIKDFAERVTLEHSHDNKDYAQMHRLTSALLTPLQVSCSFYEFAPYILGREFIEGTTHLKRRKESGRKPMHLGIILVVDVYKRQG